MSSIRRSVALGLTGGLPLAVTALERPDRRQTDLVYLGRSPTGCLEQVSRTVDTTSAVTPADRLDNCATPSADLLGFWIPRSLGLSKITQANRSFSHFKAPGSGVPLAGALRARGVEPILAALTNPPGPGTDAKFTSFCARRARMPVSRMNSASGHDHPKVLALWAH